MKIKLAISFCFIFLFSYGQADSLPQANKIVLDYVNANIGKKIRTGLCFDFVDAALHQVDPSWKSRKKRFHFSAFYYGKKISRKKLLPGDIIFYEWKYISSRNRERESHVCIVYSIDKDRKIKVAEQNAEKTIRKSIVVIDEFDPTGSDNKETKIYKLQYYRPY